MRLLVTNHSKATVSARVSPLKQEHLDTSSRFLPYRAAGTTCYYGTSSMTCDTAAYNGWRTPCLCPQPSYTATATLSFGASPSITASSSQTPSNSRTGSQTASITLTPPSTRSPTSTPTASISPGGSPSATATVAPQWYLGNANEGCTATCARNGGLACSASYQPQSPEEVSSLFDRVGLQCSSVSSGWWARPMVGGSTCYFGTASITCDQPTYNG